MKTLFKLTAIASAAIVLTACGGGGGGGGSVSAPTQDQYGNQLGVAAPFSLSNSTVQQRFQASFQVNGNTQTIDSGWQNTSYTERTIQEGWINGDVQAAWASGWTGKGQRIGILDDFTADKTEDFVSASGRTEEGVDVSIRVPFTHGNLVAAIAGGKLDTLPFTGNVGATSFTGTWSLNKPIYGVAKDAEILRNDFLTRQGGLFQTMKGWSDANNATWKSLTVVNLSLGREPSANQAAWELVYNPDIAIANSTTNVPDAVFVKAAGNESRSSYAWDTSNAVLVNSTPYGNKTIIVGATDQTGNIASYSNRAGTTAKYQNRFLVADGTGFVNSDGTPANEGTSFAAPRVAGYAAIVRHKFSALDAPTTATHLLNTTKWNAAWGAKNATTQAIYGQGEASLSQALAPSARIR